MFWLARKNFLRSSQWNIATTLICTVSIIIFFLFYLFHNIPNKLFLTQIENSFWLVNFLVTVILFLNFISLMSIFYLINRVRSHEIGVLRGIGAKRGYIFLMVMAETQLIVIMASVFALIISIAAVSLWGKFLKDIFTIPSGIRGFFSIFFTALLSILSTSVISFFAALYPAFNISISEPYSVMRRRE